MVSGFLTSPCDHDRIISGDAIEMRMALNANGFLGFSKIPKRSSIPDCSLIPRYGRGCCSSSSTLRQSDCSSLTITLNDSGSPGSSVFSPLTIASYIRVRPATSSDLTVGFERPHFHLAEPLAAELRLAAQGLLRNQAVGTGRARVNLLFDQMMQLHDVHHADRDRLLEHHPRAAVVELALSGLGQCGALEQRKDLFLARAVED